LEEGKDFYFINPVYSVITDHEQNKKPGVNYYFINERKDLVFEYEIDKIKIL
jgi:hypothetical protein